MKDIKNKQHTIIKNTYKQKFANKWNEYKVFEHCNILGEKEEVKHAQSKMEILDKYNLV